MAVARLVRVTLEAPRGEVGSLVGKVIKFSMFHPSRSEGTVQDIGLLILGSKAHEVYAQASEILGEGRFATDDAKRVQVEKFEAHDVEELVRVLEEYLEIIERNLSLFTATDDKWGSPRCSWPSRRRPSWSSTTSRGYSSIPSTAR